ncbi:Uncharacterized membrane protein YdjX, TVP38/TMEM64 family, SNARE-associated domain [Microbulbifer thermotolerans]|uniref:TVP38/TMEM64 family protein n=1 Tax=Microbulbifer thermotolerans TaxID=252514 RepID=UPI0008EAFA0A|nr:TVP38/TMEM64 family protein [Microbulbifer thermotolerans]SFB82490.1 Uncharacterized membrane protein YdjX, TVP38/TMEM64 family, SNARE-associated domain [Microbulbifer thermotolerans]
MTVKYFPVLIIVVCALVVAVVISLMLYFDLDDRIIAILQWLDDQGWQASLLFILIVAVAIVLMVPGVIFTMGAGFVFGVVKGTLFVVTGTVLGATMAFLISRYLFGPRPSRWLISHIQPPELVSTIRDEGWRLIMLTRLVPLFPFKLSNYFFGLTPIRLGDFMLGNAIGVIPITLHNVYLGSIAADLTTLGQVEERTPLQWFFYGTGFLLAVAALIGLMRMARRALAQKLDRKDL